VQLLQGLFSCIFFVHEAWTEFRPHKFKLYRAVSIKWRDAEMAAIYPEQKQPGFYGSSFAGCWSSQLATLTRERTLQLRKWLDGVQEGDVCSGSIPVKTSE
jgi:hypothetical protein